MTRPEHVTPAQAADPATPQQLLADVAAARPDLRPVVAANPSAYPALLQWLAALGEPAVDEALRRRAAGAQAGSATPDDGPAVHDEQPGPHATPSAAPPARPWGDQPAREWPAAPVWGGSAPGGSVADGPAGDGPARLGASDDPGTRPYPQAGDPYVPVGDPYAPPRGAPALPLPAGGYAPQHHGGGAAIHPGVPWGEPARPRRRTWLWVLLSVLGVLLVGAVVVTVLVARAVGSYVEQGRYGADPALDALYDACGDEDWQACDDLYLESPIGSQYESFGATCGGRTAGEELCVDELGHPADVGVGPGPGDGPVDGPDVYGDDPFLDELWDACTDGDGAACDDLYFGSPVGSEYEWFGWTCGDRTDDGELCAP